MPLGSICMHVIWDVGKFKLLAIAGFKIKAWLICFKWPLLRYLFLNKIRPSFKGFDQLVELPWCNLIYNSFSTFFAIHVLFTEWKVDLKNSYFSQYICHLTTNRLIWAKVLISTSSCFKHGWMLISMGCFSFPFINQLTLLVHTGDVRARDILCVSDTSSPR